MAKDYHKCVFYSGKHGCEINRNDFCSFSYDGVKCKCTLFKTRDMYNADLAKSFKRYQSLPYGEQVYYNGIYYGNKYPWDIFDFKK